MGFSTYLIYMAQEYPAVLIKVGGLDQQLGHGEQQQQLLRVHNQLTYSALSSAVLRLSSMRWDGTMACRPGNRTGGRYFKIMVVPIGRRYRMVRQYCRVFLRHIN